MRRTIKPRIFAFIFSLFLTISLGAVLVMAVISYVRFEYVLTQNIQDKLIAISNGRRALIGNVLDEIYSSVSERASAYIPLSVFEKLNAESKRAGIRSDEYKLICEEQKSLFRNYFGSRGYLYDLLLIDAEGNVIFTMLNEGDFTENINGSLLKNTSLARLITSVNLSLSTAISDPQFYAPSNRLGLFVAAPVFSKNRFLGEIVFQIKPELLNYITQDYTGLPSTGDIILGKRLMNKIIYTTPFRNKPHAAHSFEVDAGSESSILMQKATNGETSIGLGLDYRRKEVLARWSYVPRLRWGLVVKIDKDQAYQSIYRLRNLYISIFSILGLLLMFASFVITRRITDPIRKIRDGLKIIGEGDLNYKIDINRKDEIGELSDSVNSMTEDLKRSTASRVELERIVEERTKEIRDARDSLIRAEKLAAIGKLASSVAHEIRNPLGVMKNTVYYLNMLGLADKYPEVKESLDILSQEIENSDRIIKDLLDFSHVRKPAMKPEKIDMILGDTLKHIKTEPGVELSVELRDGLPDIEVDAFQARQVFQNLIQNAMDAMNRKGKLTIKTFLEDKFLNISFTDTGCGISPDDLPKIFEPLFSTKAKGTGLGLSICASIVEGHNGKIEVATAEGKGTTFTVKLPLKQEAYVAG